MKYILSVFLLTIAIIADAQQLRKEAFDLLNLDYPGLEKVKLHAPGSNGRRLHRNYWPIIATVPTLHIRISI